MKEKLSSETCARKLMFPLLPHNSTQVLSYSTAELVTVLWFQILHLNISGLSKVNSDFFHYRRFDDKSGLQT